MTKYKKNPIIIDAFQISDAVEVAEDWWAEALESNKVMFDAESETFYIHTLEGIMSASAGDYIIRGVEGEIYPVKESIFMQTYTKLEVLDE